MKNTSIKKGIIVVIIQGTAFGHRPGAVTKVLSKPGAVPDRAFIALGKRQASCCASTVLCENLTDTKHLQGSHKYLNKSAIFEHIADLRPATKEEKEKYHKSKK